MSYWDEKQQDDETGSYSQNIVEPELSSDEPMTPEQEDAMDAELMRSVEHRLEVAALYQQFISGALFDSASTAAQTVQRRIRSFVKGELQTLLGMSGNSPRTGTQNSDFDPEEIRVLKILAAKVLKGDPTAKIEMGPQLKKMTAQPATKPTPSVVKPVVLTSTKTTTNAPVPSAPPKPDKPKSSFQVRKESQPVETEEVVVQEGGVGPDGQMSYRKVKQNGRVFRELMDPTGKVVDKRDITVGTVKRADPGSSQGQQIIAGMQALALAGQSSLQNGGGVRMANGSSNGGLAGRLAGDLASRLAITTNPL